MAIKHPELKQTVTRNSEGTFTIDIVHVQLQIFSSVLQLYRTSYLVVRSAFLATAAVLLASM